MTKEEIYKVLDAHPELCAHGWKPRKRMADGHPDRFRGLRDELYRQTHFVQLSIALIEKRYDVTDQINPNLTATQVPSPHWLSKPGHTILAALCLGAKYEREPEVGINCYLSLWPKK